MLQTVFVSLTHNMACVCMPFSMCKVFNYIFKKKEKKEKKFTDEMCAQCALHSQSFSSRQVFVVNRNQSPGTLTAAAIELTDIIVDAIDPHRKRNGLKCTFSTHTELVCVRSRYGMPHIIQFIHHFHIYAFRYKCMCVCLCVQLESTPTVLLIQFKTLSNEHINNAND